MRKIGILIVLMIITNCHCNAQMYGYNFSCVSPSGHTLYYTSSSTAAGNVASVVYPHSRNHNIPWYEFTKPAGNIIIPSTVTHDGITYTVKYVGQNAFKNCDSITSVTFGNSIMEIQTRAFEGCTGIQQLTINVPIVRGAFVNCTGLTTVTIGSNVDTMSDATFGGCTALTTVYYYADSMFVPGSPFRDGSGNSCSNLSTFIIGDNVISIPYRLLYFTTGNIHNITIPRSVKYIGAGAFMGAGGFDTVNFNADSCVTNEENVFNQTGVHVVNIGSHVKRIPAHLFANRLLQSVNGGDSIVSIGDRAFYNCVGLPSFNFSNTVRIIGNKTFGSCTMLNTILGNSIDSIGKLAFQGCTHLQDDFVIPSSVTFIGDSAFENTSISTFHFKPQTPPYIRSLKGRNQHPTIKIPCGAYDTYYNYSYSDELGIVRYPYQSNNGTVYWCYLEEEYDFGFDYTIWIHNEDMARPDCWECGDSCGYVTTEIGCDTTVTFHAVSWPGYRFHHWSTGSTETPYTIPLSENTTITAYYEMDTLMQYTIFAYTYDTSWGYVTGSGTYNAGATVTLTAVAYNGYKFDYWSDGDTANPRIITVNGDESYRAVFSVLNGIGEISNNNVRVYSCNGRIIVEGADGESVDVYDMAGRHIEQQSATFPEGVYLVKIGNSPARKVTVIR